ncbi:hypothetical protein AAVH_35349 [Aphelenchoides avenae]|nr:hypothetical protein AAVH_35349 [Aphelenchus avenae]
MVAITLKRKFHMARVMQRTLNERASEKYQRLQSSETAKLDPVRIVVVTTLVNLEGIDENWQSLSLSTFRLRDKILAAIVPVCIVCTLAGLGGLLYHVRHFVMTTADPKKEI